MASIVIGILLILLGISFAVKFVRAFIVGKLDYWHGFLPFSVVSPIFVHIAAPKPPLPSTAKVKDKLADKGKRSLIREASGLWVHLIVGPFFLIVSILLLTAGFDLVGMPGTDTLNLVLNGGKTGVPMAVTYDKRYTFRFPFLVRAMKRFGRRMNHAQIPLPTDKRLVDSADIRAEEANRQREAERDD